VADRAEWQNAVEAEVRALGRELDVPPATDLTTAVRRRLEGPAVRRGPLVMQGVGTLRRWRLTWRAALVVVAALLAVLLATPQGRAVIIHVFRFAGIELRQEPGPAHSAGSGASLPGERRMSLEQARHQVSFPILVPAVGQPLQATGWLRGSPQLARTLAQLGVPPGVQAVLQTHPPATAHPAAAHQSGPPIHGWLIGSAAAVAAAAFAGTALWLRHRRPATVRDGESRSGGAAGQ
jgi:hypothetical protein